MPAKKEEPNAARRSQRQRIDLGLLNQEGFDRSDMERALRASLEESKSLPNTTGPVVLIRDVKKNGKTLKTKKTVKKTQEKTVVVSPAIQKKVVKEKQLEEKPKKAKAVKKEKVIVEKSTKGKTAEPKVLKTKKKIAAPIPTGTLLKSKNVVKAKNTKKITPIKKSIVKQPLKKPKQSSDRKRMAHTQASDFIALLSRGTKIVKGSGATDYVL